MFGRNFYLRFDAKRLRLDAVAAEGRGYDEPAVMALRDAGTRQAMIVGVGQMALTMSAQPSVTLVYPFDHPRLVIGDFTVAEKVVLHAIRELKRRQPWSLLRPVSLVVHPLRTLEGGLSQIEHRALLELAECSGARRAAIHTGHELTMPEIERYAAWEI